MVKLVFRIWREGGLDVFVSGCFAGCGECTFGLMESIICGHLLGMTFSFDCQVEFWIEVG